MEFGATDLGGPKNASPSQATTPDANLTNELIRRKVYSRWFALCALAVMMISAVGCLVFSLYVGSHYLNQIDRDTERRIKAEETALVESQKHDVAAPQKMVSPVKIRQKKKPRHQRLKAVAS